MLEKACILKKNRKKERRQGEKGSMDGWKNKRAYIEIQGFLTESQLA